MLWKPVGTLLFSDKVMWRLQREYLTKPPNEEMESTANKNTETMNSLITDTQLIIMPNVYHLCHTLAAAVTLYI